MIFPNLHSDHALMPLLSVAFCLFIIASNPHTVHGVLKARILKWFAIPFSSRPCFVRTLHHDSTVLRGATQHGHSFTELDKAVIQVISLVRK